MMRELKKNKTSGKREDRGSQSGSGEEKESKKSYRS
jgi:hypothetical protein